MDRCSLARAQLSRTLRQLGVEPKGESERPAGKNLNDWLQTRRARQSPQEEPISAEFDQSGEECEPL
jgi:hypothetical protein